MTPNQMVLVELVLVFGGVIGFAVWQLISVRRSLRRDREAAEGEETESR